MSRCPIVPWDPMGHPTSPWYLPPITSLGYILGPSCPSRPIVPWFLGIPSNIPPVLGLELGLGLGLGLVGHPMRSQSTVRQWDGTDKRDQAYLRPGTGGMSHGIPRHHGTMGLPTAKSDNPHVRPMVFRNCGKQMEFMKSTI